MAAGFALALMLPATAAPVHRIVAVGDLHGDFAAWRKIGHAANLVDQNGNWIGGDTVLVQTGDVVDRGPDSLKIIQDLMHLQRAAARDGGRVITLVGNHEAMNMLGDYRYVTAADDAAYADRDSEVRRQKMWLANKAGYTQAWRQRDPDMTDDAIKQAWFAGTPPGRIEHEIAWLPDGRIGRWIVGNPAVALVDGTLFVHGGISPAYAHMPLEEINKQVAAALKAGDADPKAILSDPVGPLWYRGLAMSGGAKDDDAQAHDSTTPPEPPVEEQLAQLLPAFGAKRIVIGHTPLLTGIAILQDGKLIRIDTGISAFYGGALSYLEILDGVASAHTVSRT